MKSHLTNTAHSLPHLGFADLRAPVELNLEYYSDRVASVLTSLERCESLEEPGNFRGKTRTLHINGLNILACASTSMRITTGTTRNNMLIIPMEGHFTIRVDQLDYPCEARQTALLIPARDWVGTFVDASVLAINLSHKRLVEVSRTMLGDSRTHGINLRDDTVRLIPLVIGDLHFDALFRHLCDLIDMLGVDTDLLERLWLDTSIYRYAAMMLYPDIFDLYAYKSEAYPRKIRAVCEYVRAHLGSHLTLSRLEEVSGLSRRSLQYAFISHFHKTPMEWVRDQRLIRANVLLKQAEPGVTIKSLAIRCGFTNPASFAAYYREKFGELPSETTGRPLRMPSSGDD